MKKIIPLSILLFVASIVIAQKPNPNKAPTKAEIDAMVKDAQKELNKISPEDRKKMEEMMGKKIPTKIETPKGFEKNYEKALNLTNRKVPKKDAIRIAAIQKEPLTNSNILSYLQKVNSLVISKLNKQTKVDGEKLIKSLNPQDDLYGVAINLWIMNKAEMSLYLFGKSILANPINTEYQNNYAAYISMAGGAQLAIPILEKLNKEFPKNSTVLNNLGQAWFELGELEKADKYLSECLLIAANHSQANATKCALSQEKGKTKEAVEAMKKSIKQSYSKEKEDVLDELNYKLTKDDMDWNFAKKDDNLGLANFSYPPYFINYNDQKSYLEVITEFRTEIGEKIKKLQANLDLTKVNPNLPMPPFFHKAFKLNHLANENNNKICMQAIKNLHAVEADCRKKFQEAMDKTMGMDEEKDCPKIKALLSESFEYSNTKLRTAQEECLKAEKNYINDDLGFQVYLSSSDAEFEQYKISSQIAWLIKFLEYHEPQGFYSWCEQYRDEEVEKKEKKKKQPIPDFEDTHCSNKVSFSTPFGEFSIECNKSKLKLSPSIDFMGIKAGAPVEYIYEGNSKTGKSTHEIGIGWDKKLEAAKGPFSVEVKVEAKGSVFVEMDSKGISDVGVKGKAEVGVSADANITKVSETNVNIGKGKIGSADVKIGVNSGASGNINSILGNGSF